MILIYAARDERHHHAVVLEGFVQKANNEQGREPSWRGLNLAKDCYSADALPPVKDCTVNDCRYNDRWYCRAQEISIGKFAEPICNAYEKLILSASGDGNSIAKVTACEIHRCLRNRAMKCTAYAINVRMKEGIPRCQSFKNRYK